MLYKKEGLPEEDEIVLCTVSNVQHHSVFATLDDYGKSGMIHISEVSPGRIRNLRDYVQEGKKVVCKILKVDKIKGHIDLSLRRVTESQRRNKVDAIKQEQKAENIIEGVAKKLKMDFEKLYDEISSKVFEKYEYIHECFNAIVAGETSLEKLKVEPKLAKDMTEAVKERIKPLEVSIKGDLILISYDEEGVEVVKNALRKTEAAGKEQIDVKYKGAGKYTVVVKSDNYKDAEKVMDKSVNAAIKFIEKKGGEGSFERTE